MGLSEKGNTAEGYEAIFGKKKATEKKAVETKAEKAKPEDSEKTPKSKKK